MSPVYRNIVLIVALAAAPVAAQDANVDSSVSPARIVAGVREYPPQMLRALLQAAEEPLVLRQLAEDPGLLERPESISPPVSSELRAAIRELNVMPVIVGIAADHPMELDALRDLYARAPMATEEWILQLRSAYDSAEIGAAATWQNALERDPAALDEYCRLVTRFCQEQRSAYADFPCIEVRQCEYYYACPPSEAIALFASEHAEFSKASAVIDEWWRTSSPYELDARIIDANGKPAIDAINANTMAAWPPGARAALWSAAAGDGSGAVGLMPVIMQPPADQPPEARYARAVSEHARLWMADEPLAEEETAPSSTVYGAEPESIPYDSTDYDSTYTDPTPWDVADDPWDTAYEPTYRSYGATVYPSTSYTVYHRYYEPVAVYYGGYPWDWPLFYGCEPVWLVRHRICCDYYRCVPRTGVRIEIGGRYRRDHGYGVHFRIGSRDYSRCSRNQILYRLQHRRPDPRRWGSHSRWDRGRNWWDDHSRDGRRPPVSAYMPPSSRGTRPHSGFSSSRRERGGSSPADPRRNIGGSTRRPTSSPPSSIGNSTRRSPGVSQRSSDAPRRPTTTPPRISGPTRRPTSTPPRISRPSNGSRRGESGSTMTPGTRSRTRPSIIPQRRPSSSSSSGTSSRGNDGVRSSPTPRRSPSIAPRPSSNSKSQSRIAPRPSANSRSQSRIAPRPPSRGSSRSAVSSNRGSEARRGPAARPSRPSNSRSEGSKSRPQRSSRSR